MNKKLVLLGILLLVGLTLSGCIAAGGYGFGYGYDYGYGYSYPHSYGYYNYGYGYPYGYKQPHRDWDDHRGSWDGPRPWR
jgi:hypothetical protein